MGVEGIGASAPGDCLFDIQEKSDYVFFLMTSAVLAVIYFAVWRRKKPAESTIYGKEGLVIVAVAWMLWSVFGAIPFYHIREVFRTMWMRFLRRSPDLPRPVLRY